MAVNFSLCSRDGCYRQESLQYGTGECAVHAQESLGPKASDERYSTAGIYTVRCLHCGYVPVPGGAYTMEVERILHAYEQGSVVYGAITCPTCNGEIDSQHVAQGKVICAWHEDLRDPKNAGASHGLCHECEMKMQQEGRAL